MSFQGFLCAALVSTFAVATAQAQTQTGRTDGTFPKVSKSMSQDYIRPHIGLFAGLANPEAGFDTSMEYGLDVGFQPWAPFGLGFELSGLGADRKQDNTQDLSRTNVMFKGTYNLGGGVPVIRHSFLGLGLGAVVDTGAYKGVHSGIAPLIGFDIPINASPAQYFSLGGVAKYVFVSGPSPDSVSVNGVVKYWF